MDVRGSLLSIRFAAMWLVLASLACHDQGSPANGGATSAEARFGYLQVALTDKPIDGHDVTAVNICFERVDIVYADDQPHGTIDVSRTIDLLELAGGVTTSLGIAQFPVGLIQQVRLILCPDGASAIVDGVEVPVKVPGGEQTGLKLMFPGGFEIRENVTTTIVLDFDAERSLHFAPGQSWMLTPVVQLVEAAIVLAVTNPTPGAFVLPTLTVQGTVASKEPLASLAVNGVEAVVVGLDWSAEITVPVGQGSALITVVATDVAGRSATVTFAVVTDAIPPLLRVDRPLAPTSMFYNSVLTVSGIAKDLESDLAVLVAETVAGVTPVPVNADGSFDFLFTLDAIEEQDGVIRMTPLVLVAQDVAGNISSAQIDPQLVARYYPRFLRAQFSRLAEPVDMGTLIKVRGAKPWVVDLTTNEVVILYGPGVDLDAEVAALQLDLSILNVSKIGVPVSTEVQPVDFFRLGVGTSQFSLVTSRVAAMQGSEDTSAWDYTTGSFGPILGVLDSSVDYTHADMYQNVWINRGEIPAPGVNIDTSKFTTLADADGDGIITFADLNNAANLAFLRGPSGHGGNSPGWTDELPERCTGPGLGLGSGLPENPDLPCNPNIDGGDLVDGDIITNVGYEGDLNSDGCPGVCGVDDDADGGADLFDLQVYSADYDQDGTLLVGDNLILESRLTSSGPEHCALFCELRPGNPACRGGPTGYAGSWCVDERNCCGDGVCCDDDLTDLILSARDDDENGFADDIIGFDFGCDRLDGNRQACLEGDLFTRRTWDNAPLPDNAIATQSSHGTAVASIIGAMGNNLIGPGIPTVPIANIAGINWHARVLPVAIGALDGAGKGLAPPSFGYAYLKQVAKAENRSGLASRLIAVNASFGGARDTAEEVDNDTRALGELDRRGVLFVASAGNGGNDHIGDDLDSAEPDECDAQSGERCYVSPAMAPWDNVIAVAAVDRLGALAKFSNFGYEAVDLAAPGDNIVTGNYIPSMDIVGLDAGNQIGFKLLTVTFDPFETTRVMGLTGFNGTSAAAPHVTGVIGLMLTANPSLHHSSIRQILFDHTRFGIAGSLPVASGGMLDARTAVQVAACTRFEPPRPDCPPGVSPPTEPPPTRRDVDLAPRISEDGRVVAFLTTTPSSDNPLGKRRLATVAADAGTGFVMLGPAGSSMPVNDIVDFGFDFSAAGDRIAFVSNRDGENLEVFVVDVDRASGTFGLPIQVTHTPPSVNHKVAAISGNGGIIAWARKAPSLPDQILWVFRWDDGTFSMELPLADTIATLLNTSAFQIHDIGIDFSGGVFAAAVESNRLGEPNHGHVLAWKIRPGDLLPVARIGAELTRFRAWVQRVAITQDGQRVAFSSGCEMAATGYGDELGPAGCSVYGTFVVDISGFEPPSPFDPAAHSTFFPVVGGVPTDFADFEPFYQFSPAVGGISSDGTRLAWSEVVLPFLTPSGLRPPGDRTVVVASDVGDILNVVALVQTPGSDDLSLESSAESQTPHLAANGSRIVFARAAESVLGVSASPQRIFRIEVETGSVPVQISGP